MMNLNSFYLSTPIVSSPPRADWKQAIRSLNDAMIDGNFFDFVPAIRANSQYALDAADGDLDLTRIIEAIQEMGEEVAAIERKYADVLWDFDRYVEIADGDNF